MIFRKIIFVLSLFVFSCNDDSNISPNNNVSNNSSCGNSTSTIKDVDGNSYNVVHIGQHCWMKENLKTTKFKNGQPISSSSSSASGRLYNWYTVSDPQGLCPSGWHIPTNSEFLDLVGSVDPNATLTLNTYHSSTAGGSLKSTSGWSAPNSGASNASGFTALPDGAYFTTGTGGFYGQGQYAYFWTSEDCIGANPWSWILYYDKASIASSNYLHGKSGKISVRCVKD